MNKLNEWNEKIKFAALNQQNDELKKYIKERNDYLHSFDVNTQKEMMKLIHRYDEKLFEEIKKIKDETEKYLLTQVAKKRATVKYNEY